MSVMVMYKNDVVDTVEPSVVDELIYSNKIKKLFRSEGWVTVGVDPVRGWGGNYKGTERRKIAIDISGIAHDFNNLLMSILGNISLARTGPQDKINNRLEEAEKAVLRAKDLTQRLLTLTGARTALTVCLPAPGSQVTAPEAEGVQVTPGEGKILIMDDEEVIRQVAGDMLKHMGYEVESVKDCSEAVAVYSKALKSGKPFDVVIMDLTIPGGMGGKETIKKLLEIHPGVKAIIASGCSSDPVMANYTDYGFSGIMEKPFKIGELSEQIRKVMKGPA